jgi:hypothetical protein
MTQNVDFSETCEFYVEHFWYGTYSNTIYYNIIILLLLRN